MRTPSERVGLAAACSREHRQLPAGVKVHEGKT